MPKDCNINLAGIGSGDREAEGVRLESVCTLTGYRGFESLPLRLPAVCGSRVNDCRPTPSGLEGSSGKWFVIVHARLTDCGFFIL